MSDPYKIRQIHYELEFVKMQFSVKSISLWQQYQKNFEIDNSEFGAI